MAGPLHTYGPTCLLDDDDPDPSTWHSLIQPPRPRPQFFYVSSLPIDDPLSSLPPPSSGHAPDERVPPQPFSVTDNIALEEAWLSLRVQRLKGIRKRKTLVADSQEVNAGIAVPGRERVVNADEDDQADIPGRAGSQRNRPAGTSSGSHTQNLPQRPASHINDDIGSVEYQGSGSKLSSDQSAPNGSIPGSLSTSNPLYRKRELSPTGNAKSFRRKLGELGDDSGFDLGSVGSLGHHSRDGSISGSPFIRAPVTQPSSPLTQSIDSSSVRDGAQSSHEQTASQTYTATKPSGLRTSTYQEEVRDDSAEHTNIGPEDDEKPSAKIPVGVSRLHLVELPNLKMKPIYWSPLHDVSNVLRATWFYKNTMSPVETELANRLEEGYIYLRPWTETWQDELNSCVENGADAEMKIVHRLWPKDDISSSIDANVQEVEGHTSESAAYVDFWASGGSDAHAAAVKPYMTSSVVYADGKNAQILRPSLLPSVSRGRRPLSAIRKGRQIGIPVVRGFSRKQWDLLHPSKPSPVEVRNYLRRAQDKTVRPSRAGEICYACAMEEARPTPTDLVFVIHGIGQKLSERMESFHFTHAINAFRRQVNVELNSEEVWPHVREGHGGIMVLPVNWRSTLSLEDPNLEAQVRDDPTMNHFTLKDITPETIPAVRSLISDVILDIPYYLSHHKPKMIQAVVKEANRVFRLWCKNNPGFQQNGRVHLVAHSLGSAMAVDILSHQPTRIPDFDFSNIPVHPDIFEFDTKNLFICGSPVGLFLFINKANLSPRRGRDKPGSEGDDRLRGVAGEADTYGCLAVDNLYNIMHTTDPIAYRLNAAVDSDLANSLKNATIPGSTSSFWRSFGGAFRWGSSTSVAERPSLIAKLPSNVEMETHDFTREEIAEKRMLLLNDNGQVDYFLTGGGGALNIQYLNMLSAHSSYWTLTDFVRFLVIEIARKQSRDAVLPALRAEKKKGWKYHKE
ncbi:DDHD domain-containing protein [Aspergillus desertorum]